MALDSTNYSVRTDELHLAHLGGNEDPAPVFPRRGAGCSTLPSDGHPSSAGTHAGTYTVGPDTLPDSRRSSTHQHSAACYNLVCTDLVADMPFASEQDTLSFSLTWRSPVGYGRTPCTIHSSGLPSHLGRERSPHTGRCSATTNLHQGCQPLAAENMNHIVATRCLHSNVPPG